METQAVLSDRARRIGSIERLSLRCSRHRSSMFTTDHLKRFLSFWNPRAWRSENFARRVSILDSPSSWMKWARVRCVMREDRETDFADSKLFSERSFSKSGSIDWVLKTLFFILSTWFSLISNCERSIDEPRGRGSAWPTFADSLSAHRSSWWALTSPPGRFSWLCVRPFTQIVAQTSIEITISTWARWLFLSFLCRVLNHRRSFFNKIFY